MKRIETSKGLWEVVEVNSMQQGQFYVDTLISEHYKLSEITEEEASSIVNDYCVKYKNPLQCLKGLLESKGIEITNNTYIVKVN